VGTAAENDKEFSMKKFLVVCFVLVTGLMTVEAQRQSFSFTGSEIESFKYRVDASSELVEMRSRVKTVYLVFDDPEIAIQIEFRDGTPKLFFMCLKDEVRQMNGNPAVIFDAWRMDTNTGESIEKFRLMNFQYGNLWVYLISKGSVNYIDLQLKV
jgi:hypothetical protein